MKLNKNFKAHLRILVFLILLFIPTALSQQVNFCCEKTTSGAFCQNSPEINCDTTSINPLTQQPYRKTATSCQSTSFCKPGCCIDTDEGLCMENTPQVVCEQSTGTWSDDEKCNVPQCDLGCCILGDQASFVTLTRCKKLSGFYNLETNFHQNIQDETTCILTAHLQDKGACVYELDSQRTCRLLTRQECMKLTISNTTSTKFHKDYLCSADELATNCGPTTETICIEGKDEVFFKDTCGNPANVYDSAKTYSQNPSYWQKIIPKEQSCGFNSANGNAGSKSCGNCDYFKGSICGKGNANYGNYICSDLNCYNTKNGNNYKNGESWCVYQGNVGLGRDLVGSRQFRHICINGEEIVEPCADFRNEICIQDAIATSEGNFKEAACRVNRWRDCIDQTEEEDCLNTDKRDCYWLKGFSFEGSLGESVVGYSQQTSSSQVFSGGSTGGFSGGATGEVIGSVSAQETTGIKTGGEGICLPQVPPGLMFWGSTDANSICSLANTQCTVKYEKGALTGFEKKATENKECLTESWAAKINNICTSFGDCGAYINIAGKFTHQGAEWKVGGTKKLLTGILNNVKRKAGQT